MPVRVKMRIQALLLVLVLGSPSILMTLTSSLSSGQGANTTGTTTPNVDNNNISSNSSSTSDGNSSKEENGTLAALPDKFDKNYKCYGNFTVHYHLYEETKFWVESVLIFAVGTLGILGNGLAFAVLNQSKRTQFNQLLMTLSIIDSVLIASFMTVALLDLIQSPALGSLLFPKILWPLGNISITASVLMVVAVSMERYLAICRPLQYKPGSFFYILLVLVVSVSVNVGRFFEYHSTTVGPVGAVGRGSLDEEGSTFQSWNSTRSDPTGGQQSAAGNLSVVVVVAVVRPPQETDRLEVNFAPSELLGDHMYTVFSRYWTEIIVSGLLPLLALIVLNHRIYVKIRKSAIFRRLNDRGTWGLKEAVARPADRSGRKWSTLRDALIRAKLATGPTESSTAATACDDAPDRVDSIPVSNANSGRKPWSSSNRPQLPLQISTISARPAAATEPESLPAQGDRTPRPRRLLRSIRNYALGSGEGGKCRQCGGANSRSSRIGGGGGGGGVAGRGERSTKFLVGIVVIFIVCQTFRLTIQIDTIINPTSLEDEHFAYCKELDMLNTPFSVLIMTTFSNFCLVLNSSINFVVYCMVGRRFRRTLVSFFRGKACCGAGGGDATSNLQGLAGGAGNANCFIRRRSGVGSRRPPPATFEMSSSKATRGLHFSTTPNVLAGKQKGPLRSEQTNTDSGRLADFSADFISHQHLEEDREQELGAEAAAARSPNEDNDTMDIVLDWKNNHKIVLHYLDGNKQIKDKKSHEA